VGIECVLAMVSVDNDSTLKEKERRVSAFPSHDSYEESGTERFTFSAPVRGCSFLGNS